VLLEELKQRISVRCVLAEIPHQRVISALGGRSKRNARFWRLFARAAEHRGDPLVANRLWEEFRTSAVSEGWLAEKGPEGYALAFESLPDTAKSKFPPPGSESTQQRKAFADIMRSNAISQKDKEDFKLRYKQLSETARHNMAMESSAGVKSDKGAPLSAKQLDDLRKQSDRINIIGGLISEFKDSYGGGGPYVGEAWLQTQAYTGQNKDKVGWWQKYRKEFDIPDLHEAFGAAVTDPEMRRWKQATIDPGMPPELIRQNLKVRSEIMRNIQSRLKSMAMETTRSGQVESASKLNNEVKTISNDDDYNKLPSGTEFIGPDGKKRRKPGNVSR